MVLFSYFVKRHWSSAEVLLKLLHSTFQFLIPRMSWTTLTNARIQFFATFADISFVARLKYETRLLTGRSWIIIWQISPVRYILIASCDQAENEWLSAIQAAAKLSLANLPDHIINCHDYEDTKVSGCSIAAPVMSGLGLCGGTTTICAEEFFSWRQHQPTKEQQQSTFFQTKRIFPLPFLPKK